MARSNTVAAHRHERSRAAELERLASPWVFISLIRLLAFRI